MNNFSLGAIPSPKDYRDVRFANVAAAAPLLDDIKASGFELLPIEHQRKIGTCVGCAMSKKKQHTFYENTGSIKGFSYRWLYGECKAVDQLPTEGTYPRLALKIMYNQGIPLAEFCPNDTDMTHAQFIDPSCRTPESHENAKLYKIEGYAMIGQFGNIGIDELRLALQTSGAIPILVQVGAEWWTRKTGQGSWDGEDILPLRVPDRIVSGHEVLIVRIQKVESRFKVWFINSWSKQWGEGGLGWFWYDEYKPYMLEAWTVVDLPDNLKEELEELPPAPTFRHYFTRDLSPSQVFNSEVKLLQTALKIEKCLPVEVIENGFYGPKTIEAVKAFQRKYNIASWGSPSTTGFGKVGPRTRSKLNEIFNK